MGTLLKKISLGGSGRRAGESPTQFNEFDFGECVDVMSLPFPVSSPLLVSSRSPLWARRGSDDGDW